METQVRAARRNGYGRAAMLGAVTIAILLWLGLTAPTAGCGDGVLAPMMALQTARSPTDLAATFGVAPSRCRDVVVTGLRTSHWADMLLFIPVYASFLAAFMRSLRGRSKAVTLFLATTLTGTVAGDVAETAAQLRILADVAQSAPYLGVLMVGNGLKTIGLALFLLGLAIALRSRRAWPARLAAILLVTVALVRLAGFFVEDLRLLAPLSALAAYGVLWIYAVWRWLGTGQKILPNTASPS